MFADLQNKYIDLYFFFVVLQLNFYFAQYGLLQSKPCTMIDVQTNSIQASFGYIVNADTLFFIKNDGEIADHSLLNHAMNRYGTPSFETLSNGRKVANLSGSNFPFSDQFSEANDKTTFTLHIWVKLKSGNPQEMIIGGRCGRNKSGTSTTDRRGARLQSDTAGTRTYILAGPNSSSWVNTDTGGGLYTNLGTTEFTLLTCTINGGTYKLYKNGNLVGTISSSTIRGGSSTGPRFYLGGVVYPDGTLWLAGTLGFFGECVLEKKVETDAQVLDFYNKTKNHYV